MSTSANPADTYRKNLIRRREGGGISVKGLTYTGGDMTLSDVRRTGYWTINCKQLVGIATSTEAGLTASRFPIRVVIGTAPATRPAAVSSSGYWRIVNAARDTILFTKRGITNDLTIRNLREYARDFDADMWEMFRDYNAAETVPNAEDIALFDSIYILIVVPHVTAEQAVLISAKVDEVFAHCRARKLLPMFKVSDIHYIECRPVGTFAGSSNGRNLQYALESMLNVKINAERLEARTPDLDPGVYTLAAYSIAAMFRYGLYEFYSSNEVHTVYVTMTAGNDTLFVVNAIQSPPGVEGPTDIAVGSNISIDDVKMSRKLSELAPGLVIVAGINHYMFNHTTGGPIVAGSLLTFLAMSNVISSDTDRADQTKITTVFYEALHPVNKRAIADLFLKECKVTTHGKDPYATPYEELDLDAFTRIRGRANPAGSHKAVVCASVLSRVIDSGLAPFLPWADEISNCIAECKEVMTIGARAHIGSDYYTGAPARTQSSTLDKYLPEMAAFITNLARGDSLAFSPHLSATVAASADLKWVSLIKALKGSDVSAIPVETVRKYLTSVGKAVYAFDAEDEGSWGRLIESSKVAKDALREFL